MDKPIQVGDLVVIVTPSHCGRTDSIGDMFRVTKIRPRRGGVCEGCNQRFGPGQLIAESDRDSLITELWRLKRIPPLEELEGQRAEETLKEPA